ncbi:hypothetical protein [Novosphingobium clariflavum]|uniref:Uncharacterized protein n=1 Tax=Novosphingobium clariflavum TaxID=2029884 RepID=A0ABV6S3J3_9SPHN|nr:hypothetical protein [Novosphingobium clariflavum]
MLKRDQFGRGTACNADHPLAIERKRQAKLVLRKRRAADTQERARTRLPGKCRLRDGEQGNTQLEKPPATRQRSSAIM